MYHTTSCGHDTINAIAPTQYKRKINFFFHTEVNSMHMALKLQLQCWYIYNDKRWHILQTFENVKYSIAIASSESHCQASILY